MLTILEAVGIPVMELPERRREKMAKVFLSVAGMKPGMEWSEARSDHKLRTRQIIDWLNQHLGERISSGSYDDIRRKDLAFPVEAGIVLKSAGNESAATNDGTRTYAVSGEMTELLHAYHTERWKQSLGEFLAGRESLAEELKRVRLQTLLPVRIGDRQLFFGPGEHNELQKAVIESFLPRFGQGAQVLYIGRHTGQTAVCRGDSVGGIGILRALARQVA